MLNAAQSSTDTSFTGEVNTGVQSHQQRWWYCSYSLLLFQKILQVEQLPSERMDFHLFCAAGSLPRKVAGINSSNLNIKCAPPSVWDSGWSMLWFPSHSSLLSFFLCRSSHRSQQVPGFCPRRNESAGGAPRSRSLNVLPGLLVLTQLVMPIQVLCSKLRQKKVFILPSAFSFT